MFNNSHFSTLCWSCKKKLEEDLLLVSSSMLHRLSWYRSFTNNSIYNQILVRWYIWFGNQIRVKAREEARAFASSTTHRRRTTTTIKKQQQIDEQPFEEQQIEEQNNQGAPNRRTTKRQQPSKNLLVCHKGKHQRVQYRKTLETRSMLKQPAKKREDRTTFYKQKI